MRIFMDARTLKTLCTPALLACFALSLLQSGPLFASTPAESMELVVWQSYCAGPYKRVHKWENPASSATIERVEVSDKDLRQGYGFVANDRLMLRQLGTGRTFMLDLANEQFSPADRISCPNFETDKVVLNSQAEIIKTGQITACIKDHPNCVSIKIFPGTYPYVFAEADGSVLAATNYGEVVIFGGTRWCRTSATYDDSYQCDKDAKMITEPTGIQFYSSIKYFDKTLVGQFPFGMLYEFNGQVLKRSPMTPPKFKQEIPRPWGYEVQSIAVYCGDLYIGYYPDGYVWRYDRDMDEWIRFTRLFSHPEPQKDFIPYTSRKPDGVPRQFFGQRVSALVPYGDSLYAFTSHLGGSSSAALWAAGAGRNFLTDSQISEYGAVWRIHRSGCYTE